MGAGSEAYAALLLFGLALYGIYTFRLPFLTALPVGIAILFVFAGAGTLDMRVGSLQIFTSLMWILVMVAAVIVTLAFWRMRRQ